MQKRFYIAYGSNLNRAHMNTCCPSARIVGCSVLEGWKLLFKKSKSEAYLSIEPDEGSSVPVGVWEVSAADECALDIYEAYPELYYKKDLILKINDIESGEPRRCEAFVYIMNEGHPAGIPSREYMDVCIEGYDDFGFDKTFLERAYAESEAILNDHSMSL